MWHALHLRQHTSSTASHPLQNNRLCSAYVVYVKMHDELQLGWKQKYCFVSSEAFPRVVSLIGCPYSYILAECSLTHDELLNFRPTSPTDNN